MTQISLSKKTRVQLILRGLLAPPLIFAFLFLVAGRWNYWQGWVYAGLNSSILLLMVLLSFRNPELVEERLNPKEGMKSWDKVYFGITTSLYFLALILAGLDARYSWSPGLPPSVYGLGVGVYLIGQAIFLWARYTNRFFSSVVRIQQDRGQVVCKDGPYRYVRHPGYVGGILYTAVIGLILGSLWACIPQLLASGLLIWRTAMEDKTLQAELPGYVEYSREIRYRLLPGVW